jgi:putative membrane-bound dehydrogenase-like protein
MEGGNHGYFSRDGSRYWQADRRPGQDNFTAHWHQEDPGVAPAGDNTGAGSPTGVVVYESDALGEKYRGMLLSADAGRNVVFAYWPKPDGAGFKLERTSLVATKRAADEGYVWDDTGHEQDQQKWFRPSDIAVGPDGAIYIADWYDPVVGGHQMHDRGAYGRIYRIAPKDRKLNTPSFDLSTTRGQIDALLSPSINVRNLGFERLKAAGDGAVRVRCGCWRSWDQWDALK